MEKWRRFKKGDKVIVKTLEINKLYYHPMNGDIHMGYNNNMLGMAGKEYTIDRVMEEEYGNIYKLNNGWSWSWTDEFLELAAPPSSNKEAVSFLSKEE